jgi:hypothetical protein
MSYVEKKYISLLSPRLIKFSKKKENLYTFRCPYCGDSQKNRNKTRGYFYQVKAAFFFKCHNCGQGRTLGNFIKDNDPALYSEYLLEQYRDGNTGKCSVNPEPKFNIPKPKFDSNIFSNLPKIASLNITHPAKKYLSNRKIPENYFSKLYFAEDFNGWSKSNVGTKESRIIIPLLSPEATPFGYQARSLDSNSKLRYITTIFDKEYPKLFGLDCVDLTKDVYVTEGPFDSMFIDNSLAMCGSDVVLDRVQYPNCIFVFDNEPRNKQIVDRIDKTIQQGNKVVIWPSTIKEKDINDMVLAGINPQQVIKNNTYQGLEAKVKFTDWKKV